MTKKRILMCAESSLVPSGFGNYTREILSRLYKTNKYEIAELSCFRNPDHPKKEPWKVYPVAVKPTDPLFKDYQANSANQFGLWRYEFALLDFKPHIVFDIRDFWCFTYQETSPLRPFYHWIIAPTYDSEPQKIDTLNTFKNADIVAFHTEWAKQDLIKQNYYNNINIGPVVSDSVDPSIFKPLEYPKEHHKLKNSIPSDAFIIGSVMRNQKRKLIPNLFKILQSLLEKNNRKIFLYLHTSYPDIASWDIPILLLQYGVMDNVLLSYHCNNCKNYNISTFQGTSKTCETCNKQSMIMCSTNNGITPSQLNEIYNVFDIYVQYAICEGFGIPVVEAASAGIPIITVDHGAMAEVGKNVDGDLVPIKTEFTELETGAYRIYPDDDQCQQLIQQYIDMSGDSLVKKSKSTRQHLLQNYSWDKTAKVFEDMFDRIDINQKLSWDSLRRNINGNFTIDNSLDNRSLVYYYVDNIINEPWLKSTNFIEELIKGLHVGYMSNGNQLMIFNKANALQTLEAYAKNKMAFESIRCGSATFSDRIQNFLRYGE